MALTFAECRIRAFSITRDFGVTAVDWQLETGQASVEKDHWHVELDPRDPKAGLKIRHASKQLGHFLRVAPKPSHSFNIQEAYVRQNDLIVRYEQSGDDLYTVQLNWRKLDCAIPNALALELWISVQTTLLDTHPTIEVCSSTPDAQWHGLTLNDLSIETSDTVVIGLVKTSGVTAMVMIESSDALQANRILGRSNDFTWKILGEFMEKGVIRRARLRIFAVAGEFARSKIAKQYRLFTDSPLPLTA